MASRSKVSAIEEIRQFEQDQEKRLETAKTEAENKLEATKKSREEQIGRAKEQALKEKEAEVGEAMKKAKREVENTVREYASLKEELKAKSSKKPIMTGRLTARSIKNNLQDLLDHPFLKPSRQFIFKSLVSNSSTMVMIEVSLMYLMNNPATIRMRRKHPKRIAIVMMVFWVVSGITSVNSLSIPSVNSLMPS